MTVGKVSHVDPAGRADDPGGADLPERRLSIGAESGADLEAWRAIASITVYDDFRRRETEAFGRIIGNGPANFTGLLDALGGKASQP